MTHSSLMWAFQSSMLMQKNNNSWPLNQDTDGLIPGEGAGFVVLKRYADALKDNDNILAVIVSSGLSNDGSAGHALLPHVEGQMLAFKRAYKNVNHGDVAYIEMHATGTKKGDVVELKAIEDFFGPRCQTVARWSSEGQYWSSPFCCRRS